MRCGPPAVALLLVAGLAAPADAHEWTSIDVRAHLRNDGRVEVVETHHIVFEKTGDTLFREIGLGTDQQIVLRAVTRTGADGEAHRLAAVDEVHGPDQFRYYQRGHIHFAIPDLGEHVALEYRFEYELLNGVTPAWGIAAGPASWAPGADVIEPWRRLAGLVQDWREALATGTTWRFDHDVLMPSRDGPGFTVKQIDYRLQYDDAWRATQPTAEIGHAIPDDRYRAGMTLAYLGPTPPAPAARQAALIRVGAIAAMPIVGLAAWLVALVGARAGAGRAGIDRAFVDQRFLTRSPEEIGFLTDGTTPKAEAMLNRLIGQGLIQAQVVEPPFDNPDADLRRVRLRLLAPAGAFTPIEQQVVDGLFGAARDTSSEAVRARYTGTDFDPGAPLEEWASTVGQEAARPAWSIVATVAALAGLGAIVATFTQIPPGQGDLLPVIAIAAFVGISLVSAWPKARSAGRSALGLLLPLVVLALLDLALHFSVNRPFPPLAWVTTSAAVIAGYAVTLLRARRPATTAGRLAADVVRMRRFARSQLKRPRPQLEDGWIPRLRALGVGPAIEAWRAKHGTAFSPPPEFGGAAPITTARFTGMAPPPWDGPAGWLFGYAVWADEAEDDDVDDAEDAEDQDDHGEDDDEDSPDPPS